MSVQDYAVRKRKGISRAAGKLLALLFACVLMAGAALGNMQFTRADFEQRAGDIIGFERMNPVYTETVDLGTPLEGFQLPEALRAVFALVGVSGEDFSQTVPPSEGGNYVYYDYGYVAPKEEAAIREAGGLVIYTVYYAQGDKAYRVHGTYNGLDEGFYACDQTGNITGFVADQPVSWTGSYNAQKTGTYTFTAKLSGFSGAFPRAEITVTDFRLLPDGAACDDGCGDGCLEHDHSPDGSEPPAFAPASIPALSDCACGIDTASKPWEHNLGCQYYAAPPCTCPGGTHSAVNKDCLQWQPPLFAPAAGSINGGGANDIASENVMIACAPSSNNLPYASTYTSGYPIPGTWVDYVNTIWRNKCMNRFAWTPATQTDAYNNWVWSGNPASTAPNAPSVTVLNNANCRPAASGGVWTVYSGEQLRYALTQFTSGQTIALGGNINLDGNVRNWESIDLTWNKVLYIEGNGYTIYNLGCTFAAAESAGKESPGGTASFVRNAANFGMKDLTFSTAKIVSNLAQGHLESSASYPQMRTSGTGIIGGAYGQGGCTNAVRSVTNVTVEKSLIFGAGRMAVFSFSGSRLNDTNTFTNVITKDNFIYGTDHVSAFCTLGGEFFNAYYCAAINNTICGIGGHSAGFMPCSAVNVDIQKSFASIEMFCSRYVGGFLGGPAGSATDCFVTGKLEGYSEMGGFLCTDQRGNQTLTRCYSTVLVGVRSRADGLIPAAQMQGGFMAAYVSASSPANGPTTTVTDAYAAGEVGSYDVVLSGTTGPESVGGFLASTLPNSASGNSCEKSFTNCYYDKQTTAMREWTIGNAKAIGSGINGTTGSIVGCLTTTTLQWKGGTGLASGTYGSGSDTGFRGFTNNAQWVYTPEHYPQLAAFVNASAANWGSTARADEVRAWSLASTATVMLNTWSEGYNWDANGVRTGTEIIFNRPDASHIAGVLAYDTVREIVSDFKTTDIAANATGWAQMIPGGATAQIINGNPPQSQNNITIAQGGGVVHNPGLDWYSVSESNSQQNPTAQTGHRPLRLTAYMKVEAGENKILQTGDYYNHRNDCSFTMMNTIVDNLVIGFDDSKFWSTAVEQPYPGTTKYYNVVTDPTQFSVGNGAWINTEIWRAKRDPNGTKFLDASDNEALYDWQLVPEYAMGVTGPYTNSNTTLDEQMWNGEFPVYTGISGTCKYIVTYYWLLEDGRYRADSKVITVETGLYDVGVNVYNLKDNSDNSTAIHPAAAADVGANTGYVYGAAAQSAQSLDHPYTTNVSAAWKKASDGVRIKKIELIMMDANDVPAGYAAIDGADLVEGTEITIPIEYYYYEMLENIPQAVTQYRLVSKKATVEVTYTVEKDSAGGYYLRFNKMVNPPEGEAPAVLQYYSDDGISSTDIYINDICNNIIVNLYVELATGLTINKYLTETAAEDETFVFQVEYRGDDNAAGAVEQTMYAVITVPWGTPAETAKTALFVDMDPGWYTVTELDANWRFTLREDKLPGDNPAATIEQRSVTLWAEGESGAVFTWCNSRKDVPWVNGKSGITNHFEPPLFEYTGSITAIENADWLRHANIVLCIDMSSSMQKGEIMQGMIEATKALLKELFDNAPVDISVKVLSYNQDVYDWGTVNESNYRPMLTLIEELAWANGTNLAKTLDAALVDITALAGNFQHRENYVILISDGRSSNNGVDQLNKGPLYNWRNERDDPLAAAALQDVANNIKQVAKFYSMFFGEDWTLPGVDVAKITKGMQVMEDFSSNDPDDETNYYFETYEETPEKLKGELLAILSSMTSPVDKKVTVTSGVASVQLFHPLEVSPAKPLTLTVDGVANTYTSMLAFPKSLSFDADHLMLNLTGYPAKAKIEIEYWVGKTGSTGNKSDGYTIVSPYENVNWASWGQYKTALHVHSTNSDGANPLWEMLDDHYAKGYDILAATDHNYLTSSWVTAANGPAQTRFDQIAAGVGRGSRGMLMIPYTNEQSRDRHLCTFFTDYNNPEFGFSLEASLAAVQDQGGLCHLNHPGRYTGGQQADPSGINASNDSLNIDYYVDKFMDYSACVGMEIINKKDGESFSDRILWDNILKKTIPQGRYVWGFSNDDTHNATDTGYSFNMFLMPANTTGDFRTAMNAGSFYAVAKVARRELGSSFVASGPTPVIKSVSVDSAAASITIDASYADRIDWISDGKVIATGSTFVLPEHAGDVGCYVRANVIGPGGIAFTQPFGVLQNGKPPVSQT